MLLRGMGLLVCTLVLMDGGRPPPFYLFFLRASLLGDFGRPSYFTNFFVPGVLVAESAQDATYLDLNLFLSRYC